MTCKKIQPTPDSEATFLTNGEPLEITQTVYDRARVIFKWCNKCGMVTRHIRVSSGLRWTPSGMMEICDPEID